jgi:predicted transposase YbfD/YdcC
MVASVPILTLSGALIVTDALLAKADVAKTSNRNSDEMTVNRIRENGTMSVISFLIGVIDEWQKLILNFILRIL